MNGKQRISNYENSIKSSDWISKDCFSYGNLEFVGNKIRSIFGCEKAFGVHVLKGRFKFCFKVESISGFISFGIADKVNVSTKYITGNRLVYENNGSIFISGKEYIKC